MRKREIRLVPLARPAWWRTASPGRPGPWKRPAGPEEVSGEEIGIQVSWGFPPIEAAGTGRRRRAVRRARAMRSQRSFRRGATPTLRAGRTGTQEARHEAAWR